MSHIAFLKLQRVKKAIRGQIYTTFNFLRMMLKHVFTHDLKEKHLAITIIDPTCQ